jgi:CRISPR type III-A-associated RAMP protein Csm4
MKIVKLMPSNHAKFHIGDSYRQLKDYFSSDQLFSTIINNVSLLYGEHTAKETIAYFDNDKISISSVFYGLAFCHKEEEKNKEIYFLPKPYWLIKDENTKEIDLNERKKIKKVQFISFKAYVNLLKSWNEDKKCFTYNLLHLPVIGNKFAIAKEELNDLDIETNELNEVKIVDKYSMPKVSVNRLYGDSNAFYFDDISEIKYTKLRNCIVKPFMYFIYDGEISKEIKAAINMIQDEGIGGKRSRGLGLFKNVDFDESQDGWKEELNQYINHSGKYHINISSVFPKPEETKEILSYRLESRSGFIFSDGGQGHRKKSVRIIKEGSMFEGKIQGMIKDITPKGFDKHRVWIYGKALLIGFGGEKS